MAIAASGALLFAVSASAASAPGEIEEIIVTARKIQENLQDVPIPVSAFPGPELEEASVFEMQDLGRLVPNMTTPGAPETAVRFQIRGQIQNDIIGTLDPSVGFYDDGVYVARPHGANVSFFDVQSVQVLRGPQGTLFGRNTTGGAVLLATNDPDFEGFSGSVGAGLASHDQTTLSGVLNAPVVDRVLALRLAAQSIRSDGYAFDETNGRKVGTEGTDLFRAKLLWQPIDDLSFLVKGQYIDVDQLGAPIKALFALDPEDAEQPGVCCLVKVNNALEMAAGGPDYDDSVGGSTDRVRYDEGLTPVSKITVRGADLTTVWNQPWATTKLIAGFRENADAANRTDVDGTPSHAVDTLQANENRQQSYELQLTGGWLEDRLRWAAGVYYFREDGAEKGTSFAFVPLLAAVNPVRSRGDILSDSIGGYVQATYGLLPSLRLTGGVRYTQDGKELVLRSFQGDRCSLPDAVRDDPAECRATFDDSFDDTSFTTAIDYDLLEDVLVYTSVTTGYRAGGQNLRGTSVDTLQPFDPETLLQVEGGFKSELLGRRVRVNAAGYHTFYDDIQRTVVVASSSFLPSTLVTNAGSAEISGTEIEISALGPVDGLELGATFGLTLARYNEFTDATGNRVNEKFDLVPEKTYSLSGTYTRAIFDVPWRNRIDWSWVDEIPHGQGNLAYFRNQGFDIEPLVTEPAQGFLGVRSGVELPMGIEASFFARNLFDKRTFEAQALGGGPDFAFKWISNAGREIGGQVLYRF